MLPITLYPYSLLALLSIWHGGSTLPVMTKEPVTDTCVHYAQALLDNIAAALNPDNETLQENLFKGINCTQQTVDLNTKTDTPSACAPHGISCSGESKSHFNQELCMQYIRKDLNHFYKFLSAHPDPDRSLRSTVLLRLRELIMNCSWTLPEDLNEIVMIKTYDVNNSPQFESPSRYDDRLSLCKKLKGFQIRAITINRALGYMRSGDHYEIVQT